MRLGLMVGYSGAHVAIDMEMVREAERLGYHSVWTAEAWGSDAVAPLAWIAAQTTKIKLGTAIMQLPGRSPANTAMTAMTLDALSGGRFILGLGTSGPQVVEGWHGVPFDKPLTWMREYLEIVKLILAREKPLEYQGERYQIPYRGPGATGLGKPLKSILHGNPNIPVMLGASTPGNIRLTGEIADGWLCMHVTPDTVGEHLQKLSEGLSRRSDGKTLKDMEIITMCELNVTEDVKGALAKAKPETALYVGGMGAKGKNFHKDAMVARGFGEAADRIEELFRSGRKEEAAAAVPDEYIDEGGLIGPPARIREKFRRWADAGFTSLRFHNPSQEAMRTIAQVAREEGALTIR